MSRDERERLRDIKDAIVAIRDHLAGAGEAPADNQAALLHDALLFQFVVIGEAVKHLTTDTRESAPEIPWADVAGLRDLIAHEYFRIEIDRVLAVVERDLPPSSRRSIGCSPSSTRLTAGEPSVGGRRRSIAGYSPTDRPRFRRLSVRV